MNEEEHFENEENNMGNEEEHFENEENNMNNEEEHLENEENNMNDEEEHVDIQNDQNNEEENEKNQINQENNMNLGEEGEDNQNSQKCEEENEDNQEFNMNNEEENTDNKNNQENNYGGENADKESLHENLKSGESEGENQNNQENKINSEENEENQNMENENIDENSQNENNHEMHEENENQDTEENKIESGEHSLEEEDKDNKKINKNNIISVSGDKKDKKEKKEKTKPQKLKSEKPKNKIEDNKTKTTQSKKPVKSQKGTKAVGKSKGAKDNMGEDKKAGKLPTKKNEEEDDDYDEEKLSELIKKGDKATPKEKEIRFKYILILCRRSYKEYKDSGSEKLLFKLGDFLKKLAESEKRDIVRKLSIHFPDFYIKKLSDLIFKIKPKSIGKKKDGERESFLSMVKKDNRKKSEEKRQSYGKNKVSLKTGFNKRNSNNLGNSIVFGDASENFDFTHGKENGKVRYSTSQLKNRLSESTVVKDIRQLKFDGLFLDVSKYANSRRQKNPFDGPSAFTKFYKVRKAKIKKKIINMNEEIKNEEEKE